MKTLRSQKSLRSRNICQQYHKRNNRDSDHRHEPTSKDMKKRCSHKKHPSQTQPKQTLDSAQIQKKRQKQKQTRVDFRNEYYIHSPKTQQKRIDKAYSPDRGSSPRKEQSCDYKLSRCRYLGHFLTKIQHKLEEQRIENRQLRKQNHQLKRQNQILNEYFSVFEGKARKRCNSSHYRSIYKGINSNSENRLKNFGEQTKGSHLSSNQQTKNGRKTREQGVKGSVCAQSPLTIEKKPKGKQSTITRQSSRWKAEDSLLVSDQDCPGEVAVLNF